MTAWLRHLLCVTSVSHIGDEGARALGPHLEKLTNMKRLNLYSAWCFGVHRALLWWSSVPSMMTTLLRLCLLSDNHIGDEGAAALGPHLSKLTNMTSLNLYSA